MTEEEAKARWCPFARVGHGNRMAVHLDERDAMCRGSACMAWRWVEWPDIREVQQAPLGYCGLAGIPCVTV